MNRARKGLLTVICPLLAVPLAMFNLQPVRADNTDAESVSVSGSVVAPIAITSFTTLQTGNIVKPSSGEFDTTVNIPPNGASPFYTNGGDPGAGARGTQSPSTVAVSGAPLTAYLIGCESGANAGNTVLFSPLCPDGGPRTLGVGGTDSFTIGGTLSVKRTAPVDPFNFGFDVTVTYN